MWRKPRHETSEWVTKGTEAPPTGSGGAATLLEEAQAALRWPHGEEHRRGCPRGVPPARRWAFR